MGNPERGKKHSYESSSAITAPILSSSPWYRAPKPALPNPKLPYHLDQPCCIAPASFHSSYMLNVLQHETFQASLRAAPVAMAIKMLMSPKAQGVGFRLPPLKTPKMEVFVGGFSKKCRGHGSRKVTPGDDFENLYHQFYGYSRCYYSTIITIVTILATVLVCSSIVLVHRALFSSPLGTDMSFCRARTGFHVGYRGAARGAAVFGRRLEAVFLLRYLN